MLRAAALNRNRVGFERAKPLKCFMRILGKIVEINFIKLYNKLAVNEPIGLYVAGCIGKIAKTMYKAIGISRFADTSCIILIFIFQ